MAYNSAQQTGASPETGWVKFKSDELAALDCGHNIKINPGRSHVRVGTFTSSATKVLGVGECVAMVRVFPGESIEACVLTWANSPAGTAVPRTLLAVGDPYACGRFLGHPVPIDTITQSGVYVVGNAGPYGACGTMMKIGTVGDGCGIGYTYTCETDIVLTNLYNAGFAGVGGFPGAAYAANASLAGAAVTSGVFKLIVTIRPPIG